MERVFFAMPSDGYEEIHSDAFVWKKIAGTKQSHYQQQRRIDLNHDIILHAIYEE